MNKKLTFTVIIVALQIVLAGNAFAADFWWSGSGSDDLWNNPNNYWVSGVPLSSDTVHLDNPVPLHCLIDSTVAAVCYDLYVGDWSSAIPDVALLDVDNGTLTVGHDLVIGTKETSYQPAGNQAIGDVNMIAGTITVGQDMWVGSEGVGKLHMRGGAINITGTLKCPGGKQPAYTGQRYTHGTGQMTLYGGTVSAADIYSDSNDTCQIDISGGTLILNGDKTAKINDLAAQERLFAYGRDGEIQCDYNISNTGKTTVTGSFDSNLARLPSPINYAQEVSVTTQLSWTAGAGAASHDVYFGTSFSDVNDANHSTPAGIWKANQPGTSYNPGTLATTQTYYWRIDEVNSTTLKGRVWRFTTLNPYLASAPSPANNATKVAASATLGWTKGTTAASHDVYLGTSFADVNDANHSTPAGIWKGNQVNQTTNTYNPGDLLLGKIYYWRIDEVESGGTTYKGKIWSFTMDVTTTVDNFDTYTPGQLPGIWVPVSGSGAIDSIFTDAPANDYNCMKLDYANGSSPWYSAVTYTVPTPRRNWTLGGVKILGIAFHGAISNAVEQLYVTLEDTAAHKFTVLYSDSNDIVQRLDEDWHWWGIKIKDFNDGNAVSLTGVKYVTIGLGDKVSPGGSGTIYIDNVKLYPPMCLNRDSDADLNNDCQVDVDDLVILAEDWLVSSYTVTATAPSSTGLVLWYKFDEKSGYDAIDSSGNNYTGFLQYSDVWDATGHDGNGGIIFNGTDTYIEVPIAAAADVNLGGHSTVAFWIKDNVQPAGCTLLQIGPSPSRGNLQVWSGWTGDFTYTCGEDPVTLYRDELFWGRYGFSNPAHTLGQWNHYAFTKDHDTGIMRIYHNGVAVAEYKQAFYATMPALVLNTSYFTIGAWRYSGGLGGYYTGIMDDFRLYKRALSDAEILSLAGGSSITQPVLSSANVVADTTVNFKDFAIVAAEWLKEPLWP